MPKKTKTGSRKEASEPENTSPAQRGIKAALPADSAQTSCARRRQAGERGRRPRRTAQAAEDRLPLPLPLPAPSPSAAKKAMAEAAEEAPAEEAPAAPEPEAAAAAEPAPTEEAPPAPIVESTDPTPAEAAALEAAGEAPPPPPAQYGSPPQDGMYQQPAVYNVAPMAQYTIQALAGRTVEFKLLLPHAACGIVIGKGGAMVSHIRDASGCQVDVQESPAPPPMAGGVQGGSERIITLSGDFGSVYAAFQMVLQHLAAAQPADPLLTTRPPGSVEAVVLVPRNKTGGLIGRGGASINRVRQDSGATVKVGAPEDVVAGDPDVRKCIVSGAVEQVMAAFTLIVHKLEETPAGAARAADAPPMAQGYAQNPYVQQYPQGAMPAQLAPGTMPVQFQVPNESMGAVIGRAGATINQIRSMSGAKVDIAQSVPGMPMRLVTVTGTPDQIQMAQYLIQVKMGGGSLPAAGAQLAAGSYDPSQVAQQQQQAAALQQQMIQAQQQQYAQNPEMYRQQVAQQQAMLAQQQQQMQAGGYQYPAQQF